MFSHLQNILNLNERLAYNIIGKLRELLIVFYDRFLWLQESRVEKRVQSKNTIIKRNLANIIPKVDGSDLTRHISDQEKIRIIQEAENVLEHKFTILNRSIKFDKKINWHVDFNSNYEWEKGKFYKKYNQVDKSNNADVKFPRELSRCHHFLYLGQAFLITGDEKYTREFIEEIESWIEENPYKKSINWGCSMDIAIRASNWIFSLQMFHESSIIDNDFYNKIFTSLYLHGRYIYENPEKNRVYNHNHYLSDLSGQILISLLFKKVGNKEVDLWKDNGIYEFYREIRVQILPTGFTYERTTNYHRLVTELISYTIILLKNNKLEVPQDITLRVKRMFESVLYYSFSNGFAPIIGDQDNGRFLPFYPFNINYQRYLLDIAAAFFDDGIFKNYSGKHYIDILFLMGNEGIRKFNKVKPKLNDLESRSFSDAGFYVMRSNKVYCFVNNSGLSHYNEILGGTHTHSDLLSFVYAYNGVAFLIDPGTYVYSSSPKERMKFRSTAMHNTITVDDFSQNDLKENELWSIKRDAIPEEILWESDDKTDLYEGSHSGYERLQNPVRHIRKFELKKASDNLKIIDILEGNGEHEIKCHFHFDEGVKVKIENKNVYCQNASERIEIKFDSNLEYILDLKTEFISKSYNKKCSAQYLVVSFHTTDDAKFITEIKSS